MTLVPRPYQAEALKAGLASMAPGSPQLLVLPTGTGKTPLGLWLAEGMVGERAGALLFIVHRDNLLREWSALLIAAGWHVEVERGDERADLSQLTLFPKCAIIMMKQSGRSKSGRSARYTRFTPDILAGVIWDEAHRTTAPSELEMLRHFNAVPVLGLTATPQVPGLADNWTIAYQLTLLEAVRQGWLSPPEWETVVMDWNWSAMRAPSGEDVSPKQIREYFEGPGGAIRVGPPQRVIRQRLHESGAQALVFVPGVPFGRALTNWLNTPMSEADQAVQVEEWKDAERAPEWIEEMLLKVAKPVIAALVTGNTTTTERQTTLRRMAHGTCQAVVSVLVYVDGLNIENLGMIVMMRPTMLVHLYLQMMGRGLRLHTSIKVAIGLLATAVERLALIASSPKPTCTILALVPQRAKLDFMNPAKLIAAENPELERFRPAGHEPFDGTLDEMLAQMEEQRDQWEAAEKARKDKLAMLEAAQREKRSQHLVAPGDERVTSTITDMLHVPTVPISALGMSWPQYQAADDVQECETSTDFIKARKARAKDLFDRAQAVKRYISKDGTPGFEDFHGSMLDRDWDRWRRRKAKVYRDRSPKQWQSFKDVRRELYEHYRRALIQVEKVPPEDVYSLETGEHVAIGASTKANALAGLAYGWDQASVRTEADYWHNKHDSSYEGHRQAWARKQHHGGKRRKKASR